MSVHKKIDSFERNTLSGSETSKIVFFSTVGKDEITDFINNSFPVGEETQEHGLVESARFFQESSFWCCEVNFSRSYSSGGVSIEMQGRDDGPANHSLATVNIPLDISCAKSYRTAWNHFLFALVDSEQAAIPDCPSADSATSTADIVVNGVRFHWAETRSEMKIEPFEDENGNIKIWKEVSGYPTKPGVQSIDCFTYQITEYGEYDSEEDAAWVCENVINQIRPKPLLGNMGIKKSGDWKCDSAAIRHNGQSWEAELIWTLSGDENGWDVELYEKAKK